MTPHQGSLKQRSPVLGQPEGLSTAPPKEPRTAHKKCSAQRSLDIIPRRGPESGKARDLDRAAHLLHNTHARRFWKKVAKLNGENACWVWTSAVNYDGYGQFWMGALKRNLPAHRLSYVLTFGMIGDGLLVCHKCDNPICVRPDHLFVGTQADNQRDCVAKGRWKNPNPRVSP